MTLHSAMQEVLRAAGTPLAARAVADEINRRGLYQRADQRPIGSTQVSARARNYGHIFEVTDGRIGLSARGTVTLAPQATSSAPAGATRLTVPAPTDHRSLDDIERTLLDRDRFRSARDIDAQVPNQFGLYAIRARSLDVIPEPYRAVAEHRVSTLIYLGEATGQTLQQRFLRNELRGRGHGAFFRSIGAVLGYRPPARIRRRALRCAQQRRRRTRYDRVGSHERARECSRQHVWPYGTAKLRNIGPFGPHRESCRRQRKPPSHGGGDGGFPWRVRWDLNPRHSA